MWQLDECSVRRYNRGKLRIDCELIGDHGIVSKGEGRGSGLQIGSQCCLNASFEMPYIVRSCIIFPLGPNESDIESRI